MVHQQGQIANNQGMQSPSKLPGQVFDGHWMDAKGVPKIPGVPSGLEVLDMLDGLMMHQRIEKLEATAQAIVTDFEGKSMCVIPTKDGFQDVKIDGYWVDRGISGKFIILSSKQCITVRFPPVHVKAYPQLFEGTLSRMLIT
ncbi:unnamed protein product [Choristocarpus tenellus]